MASPNKSLRDQLSKQSAAKLAGVGKVSRGHEAAEPWAPEPEASENGAAVKQTVIKKASPFARCMNRSSMMPKRFS